MSGSTAPCDVEDVIQLVPSLRAYARGLHRRSDEADDLVQETLLKAISNADRFQPGTNLRAWLFTIMRNTFLTNIRKRIRESPGESECASATLVTHPTHASYIEAQRVLAAIGRLPEHYREILVLVVVVGESYEDAAVICNCAVGTVKSRVNRARRLIIEDLGIESFDEIFEHM